MPLAFGMQATNIVYLHGQYETLKPRKGLASTRVERCKTSNFLESSKQVAVQLEAHLSLANG